MTLQEIFDTSVNGLRAQGYQQSTDPIKGCLYRGPNGLKCAAGFCIPDEIYEESMEREVIGVVIVKSPALQEMFPTEAHEELLRRLQSIHDSFSPDEWEEQWKLVAARYDLIYTPMKG